MTAGRIAAIIVAAIGGAAAGVLKFDPTFQHALIENVALIAGALGTLVLPAVFGSSASPPPPPAGTP